MTAKKTLSFTAFPFSRLMPANGWSKLVVLVLLALSTILPTAVLAQNCPSYLENQSKIDHELELGNYTIPCSFFGMHINSLQSPWPPASIYFANQRLEGSDVNWWNIEISEGAYDYYYLDQWIAQAQANGVTLTYTFDGVPNFYSSVPNDQSCTFEAGACDPPKDVNEDGSGSDHAFISFVTDLVKHNYELGNPIQYWELWNEPNQARQWVPSCQRVPNCYNNTKKCTGISGTNLCYAQLIRMSADAIPIIKAYNPNAVILTPAPVGYPGSAELWLGQYLQWLKVSNTTICGGSYNGVCPVPDVMSYHGYLNQWVMGDFPVPENEYKLIKQVKATIVKEGFGSKPMWISEGGWGNIILDGYDDAVLQTAFMARYILIQQSLGVPRAYWYQWDQVGGAGRFWQGPGQNDMRLAGYGYGSIVQWTMNATVTYPCTLQKGTAKVWVCKYVRTAANGGPANYKSEIVWSTTGNSTYLLPAKYTQYCDLKGNVTPIAGRKVQIGMWPILLENENLVKGPCQQF